MGSERAETYLRLVAEREFRRVIHPPAGQAGPPGSRGWADDRMSTSDLAASALWNLHRAGRILIAARALDEELVYRLGQEIEAVLTVRSRTHLARHGAVSRMFEPFGGAGPPAGAPRGPAAQPTRIVPIGRAFRLASERAPADLHFLSLVATPTHASIAIVIRMHWPSDGSSADLELSGAGYHHLPYDQLWLEDDRGARYQVTFGGEGGVATWQGVLWLSPAPPPDARWLDLVADGTHRLIRLDLDPEAPRDHEGSGTGRGLAVIEDVPTPVVDRLLAVEAEAILAAAWDGRRPTADPHLGEITRVLAEAGLIDPDSQAPGQLAALCQHLGVPGPGITAPAATEATELPAPWASVIAQRPGTAGRQEVFTPLATILPDINGTRFALAGLSAAAGESYLHVSASGLPELTERFTRHWSPWFSWWVRDSAGHWHVAVIAEPSARAAGEADFRLRLVPPLVPPLAAPPETIEVVVTGASARIRAVVPVRGTAEMPDT